MTAAPAREVKAANVAAYKTILRNILEERPSGTRQRRSAARARGAARRRIVAARAREGSEALCPAKTISASFAPARLVNAIR